MARRLVLAMLCLSTALPGWIRSRAARPVPGRSCVAAGRGTPPRHWIGCAEDAGPPRDLSGQERILAGLPVDLNAGTPEDLAAVPGLSARLAIEVVRDRGRRGAFHDVDDLIRVRGIGRGRLARARPFLATGR
jgi:competence protein ComEA